jgi:exosortase C (VPDSG-CTERM-specific)
MSESTYKDGSPVAVSTSRDATLETPDSVLQKKARIRRFIYFTVVLLVCFAKPLFDLARLGFANDLYSHVFLIPAVSIYLVWIDKAKLVPKFQASPRLTIALFSFAIIFLAAYWMTVLAGRQLTSADKLSLLIPAFLFCFSSGMVWCFGAIIARAIAFPLCFLIFMVPMPGWMENGVLVFLQHSSAEVTDWMLKIAGMSAFRDGLTFKLPGVAIRVATECSGIRSSLVLFITSVLAAHLFLRRRWSKIVLAVAVVPLGILRNAVRIFVLAELAVHVDPNILDSPLHHKGGPVFFVISLAPFFLLVWLLRKQERKHHT